MHSLRSIGALDVYVGCIDQFWTKESVRESWDPFVS
jgi:hypothetical protein